MEEAWAYLVGTPACPAPPSIPRSLLADPDLGGVVASDSAWGTTWNGAALARGALDVGGDGQAAAEDLGASDGWFRRRGGDGVASGGWGARSLQTVIFLYCKKGRLDRNKLV